MKKLHKSQSLVLNSFTGLLLVLNSLILPQLATIPVQPTNADLAAETTEFRAKTPAQVLPVAVKAKPVITGRVIYVTMTAYSSTPDQTDSTPFITANGTYVRDGIIAANFLRFGTKVKFPDYSGDKIYEVTDRMNARYPNRADIWMETRDAAMDFGVRTLKMKILPAAPAVLAEK